MTTPKFLRHPWSLFLALVVLGSILFAADWYRLAIFEDPHMAPADLPAPSMEDRLRGNDADRNGVRDDIEAVLGSALPESASKHTWLSYARALQSASETTPETPDAHIIAVKGSLAIAKACLIATTEMSSDDVSMNIVRVHSLTIDNADRSGAWAMFEARTSKVPVAPGPVSCDERRDQ